LSFLKKPFFSIITVTLNCKNDLSKTISSVQSQNYNNYVHIIKDGYSTDGTQNIDLSNLKNTRIYIETDKGVYDAMNQATKYSKGDYILFLNSGDYFASESILTELSKVILDNPKFNCFVGQTLQIKCSVNKPFRLLGANWINNFFPLVQMPHPSFIIKRQLLSIISPPFDADLKIASDYKQQLLLRKCKSLKIYSMKLIMTIMPLGGKSTKSYNSYFKGFLEVANFSYEIYGFYFLYILILKILLNVFTRFYSKNSINKLIN
tara:strand:- start:14363 stop:15151 length:789 start_codon:yes stop_codon:yes gene_type:complete